jgi:Na+-transporting NADH:ubiquinone oxidoreductase subunit B
MTGTALSPAGSWRWARGELPALLGLVLPIGWQAAQQGGGFVLRMALVGLVILGWQLLFARIRAQGFGLEGLSAAALLALLVPADAPLWQLALGASFGIVIGQLIFGGHGRNLLHPAIVALSFLMFSFAGETYRQPPELPLWTVLPGALALVMTGHASLRILVPAAAVLAAFGWLADQSSIRDLLASGLLWLALCYFAADPVASAATGWGRVAHGALAGLLIALFLPAGTALSAVVFAVLMASIFAPLLDQGAIALNAWQRERRHG